ncbi:MAG: putative toxin-antitoxin system toxin component, PIN family [Anaerosomatales bacterium]|nr:putative toxin-antitoxin system toxin component, PIN family [Anaerosomatales bacterium]
MIRAILDTNVIVAAALSRDGAPAQLLRALAEGRFDAITCPTLLDELASVFERPRIAKRIAHEDAVAIVAWYRRVAIVEPDPVEVPRLSPDPDDDVVLALANAAAAHAVVTGDAHLLDMPQRAGGLRVVDSRTFLAVLERLP